MSVEERTNSLVWRVLVLALLGALAAAAAVGLYDQVLDDESSALRWTLAVGAGAIVSFAVGIVPLGVLARREATTHRMINTELSRALETHVARRAFEDEVDTSLSFAEAEEDVIETVERAVERIDPDRPVELHLVDRHRPVLRLALSTFDRADIPDAAPEIDRTPGTDTGSPWDSLAARGAATVTYDSTDRIDSCPHLKSRITEPRSAISVPLTTMGRIVGVLHAIGPVGERPTPAATEAFQRLAARAATHIAIIRALDRDDEKPQPADLLTGLPNELTVRSRIDDLVAELTPFSLALCDLDELGDYNATHGTDEGDRAVQLAARVLADTVRPTDHIGRISEEELIIVFPDTSAREAAQVVERIRESLVLELTSSDIPPFTVSCGVADSNSGDSIEEILDAARDALEAAKEAGRNRVVIDRDRPDTSSEPAD